MALAAEGVHVTLTARGAEALAKTAGEIRKLHPGVTVTEVAGDITTPAGREAALKACPDPDILINNAGGPPPGAFRNWTRDDSITATDGHKRHPHGAEQGGGGWHDGAQVRPHRQYHLGRGKGADRDSGPVQWRARRP